MTGPPLYLVTGQPTAVPIQCYLRGSGTTPAIYNADDTLTAAVRPSRQTGNVFAPAIAWYTADNTQSGYGQGQVEASFSATQMASLSRPFLTRS